MAWFRSWPSDCLCAAWCYLPTVAHGHPEPGEGSSRAAPGTQTCICEAPRAPLSHTGARAAGPLGSPSPLLTASCPVGTKPKRRLGRRSLNVMPALDGECPRASRLGHAPAAALLSRGATAAASLASACASLPPSRSLPAPSTAARGVSAELKMPCGSRSRGSSAVRGGWTHCGGCRALPEPPCAPRPRGGRPSRFCARPGLRSAVRPGPGPLLCPRGSRPLGPSSGTRSF